MTKQVKNNEPQHTFCKRITLVLQGGGALGAYQAGVYEALEKKEYCPDWIGGTSIGAINAAIIVGNKPENRLLKLKEFWTLISQEDYPFLSNKKIPDTVREYFSYLGVLRTIMLGVPNFFTPRILSNFIFNPFNWIAPLHLIPKDVSTSSFYDISPLYELLDKVIDFKYLNKSPIRISLGATHIATGTPHYFDSKFEKIKPEHVVASAALPPGFPPIKINGEYYWDGGVYCNSPLTVVLEDTPRVSSVCFLVDLWDAEGIVPESLDQVRKRAKDITYSSRSETYVKTFLELHNMRRAISALYEQLPKKKQQTLENKKLRKLGCITSMDIVHLNYEEKKWELSTKDVDFSIPSIQRRWAKGFADGMRTLEKEPWLVPHPPNIGVVIYDCLKNEIFFPDRILSRQF